MYSIVKINFDLRIRKCLRWNSTISSNYSFQTSKYFFNWAQVSLILYYKDEYIKYLYGKLLYLKYFNGMSTLAKLQISPASVWYLVSYFHGFHYNTHFLYQNWINIENKDTFLNLDSKLRICYWSALYTYIYIRILWIQQFDSYIENWTLNEELYQ